MYKLFRSVSLVLALVLGLTLSAKADSISVFTLNATLLNGQAANGTFDLDTTTGAFISGEVVVGSGSSSLTLPTLTSHSLSGLTQVILSSSSTSSSFDLVLPTTNLQTYAGGAIASLSFDSLYASAYTTAYSSLPVLNGGLSLTSTSVTNSSTPAAVSQTPEVSTFLLMLTGFAAMAWVVRSQRKQIERRVRPEIKVSLPLHGALEG